VRTVIRLEGIGVRYRVPHEQVGTLKEFAIRRLQGRLTFTDLWALNGVNLTVAEGEVFGVIGRNGAGKSTLLKAIARVLRPTVGRVWTRGRVAPLLDITAGFHPELTGRENVFLNGVLLGHPRAEIERLFEGIVEFSGLVEFMDAPIRTYSTGMIARLAFAVATATRPGILLVDEVLSVGDEEFQQKCRDRIDAFQRWGTTIVLVSHSMAMVERMCRRALWLEFGTIRALGDPRDVVRAYHTGEQRA
jgi:ABC-2 type transport system ATP-binding protein/lipopolysaccharide transport system ATP-binding protein